MSSTPLSTQQRTGPSSGLIALDLRCPSYGFQSRPAAFAAPVTKPPQRLACVGDGAHRIDGDPAPGLQPLPAPEPEESLPGGRVLNRIARSADELESLTGQWRQLQGKKLSGAQKSKAKETILRLKAQLALLEQSIE